MILVKAPLRLSFFGGGSDIPAHFLKYGGATLSATFDKFVYAAIMPTPQPHIKVAYSTTEYANTLDAVQHDIVREALRHYDITNHIEISSFADIPTVGTGLGASSAFSVALVAGLERRHRGILPWSPSVIELVHTASHIERELAHAPIGYQDHIAAAQGGIIFARYFAMDTHASSPFATEYLPSFPELFSCLFLVKMPTRQVSANAILKHGMSTTHVDRLVDMAYQAKALMERRDVQGFGSLLHDGWREKKQMHSAISTPEIDDAYDRARRAGVLGGKLLGAGNGGYLLLCAKSPEDKHRIQNTVFADNVWYNVAPTKKGVEIVYDDSQHY